MLKDIIEQLLRGENLNSDQSFKAMEHIIGGNANDCQIASFLTAMRMKGETVEEISGFSKAMLQKAEKIYTKHKVLVDTCGTGGDKKNTFNISTAAALIAAGAGVPVAKHGNRSVSSLCGSADVLEQLGVKIDLGASVVSKCIDEIGIGFIFAPNVHTAMKNVARPRSDMGIKTVFNILGPLTNPAKVSGRVLGVSDEKMLEKMVFSLKNLGARRALVVYGMEGLDELSVCGNSIIYHLENENVKKYVFDPEEAGLKKYSIIKLRGGGAKENADIIYGILSGTVSGAKKDSAILNAAAAVIAGGKRESFKDAIQISKQSIESGNALKKLKQLIEFTNKH
jgi:anthranilate phosphoribosyltransferase